jgi:putative PEP-CTERM system TPR-repeat lipoprotein
MLVSASLFLIPLFSACPVRAEAADPARAQKYQAEADGFLAKNDYQAALVALKNARKANPQDSAVRIALARVELGFNDNEGAEIELKAARQNGGDEAKIVPLLGRVYMNQSKFEQALEDFPVRDDGTAEIRAATLVVRANAQIMLGRTDAARVSLLDAENLLPQSSAPKFALARLDFTHNDLDRALSKTNEILKIDDSADAHFLKGEILVGKGDDPGALTELDAAIKLNPNLSGALIERAQLLIGRSEDAKADADIKAALALAPQSLAAHYFQADLLVRAKDFTGADAILTKYAAGFPGFVRGYYLQAVVKATLGQYEQAQTAIDAYVAASPKDMAGQKIKADILMRKGDYAGAAQILETTTNQNPKDADAFTMLGQAYMPIMVYRSVDAFRKALELDPNNTAATRGLALDYLAENRTDLSAAEMEKSVRAAPDDARAAESLALVYIGQKHYADAGKIITDLAKKRPDDPAPVYMSGLIERDQLHNSEARAIFAGVEKKFPDFVPVKLQLAQLDVADGDTDRAREIYSGILAKDPKNLIALQGLSEILMQQKQTPQVLDLWKKSYNAQPGDISIETGLIHAYIAANDIEGGLAALRDIQLRQPKEPQLFEMRAELEVRKKDYKSAVVSLRSMNEVLPNNAIAMRSLAVTQEKAGDVPGALASIAAARKLDPLNVTLATDEVRLLGLSDPENGIAAARKFAALAPDDPAAQAVEGDYLATLNRPMDAVAAYRQAYSAHPSLLLAERLAHSALLSGNPAEGEKTLTAWSVAHPDDMPARFSLASFLQSEKNFAGAKAQYEMLLKQLPDSPLVLNNLAVIYQHDNDQRALEFARKAADAAPGNPQIADTLGWILAQKNDAAALNLLQRAHELAPGNLDTQYHLAFALSQSGKKEDAAALLKSALSSGVGFDNKSNAQNLLNQLSKG